MYFEKLKRLKMLNIHDIHKVNILLVFMLNVKRKELPHHVLNIFHMHNNPSYHFRKMYDVYVPYSRLTCSQHFLHGPKLWNDY